MRLHKTNVIPTLVHRQRNVMAEFVHVCLVYMATHTLCVDPSAFWIAIAHVTRLAYEANASIRVLAPVLQMPFAMSIITCQCVPVQPEWRAMHTGNADPLLSFNKPKKLPKIRADHHHAVHTDSAERLAIKQFARAFPAIMVAHLHAVPNALYPPIVRIIALVKIKSVSILVQAHALPVTLNAES